MADRKCQYCTKIATHSCPCQSTISYFCRLHQDEHEQIFHVTCSVKGLGQASQGKGSTRRKAEQEAAEKMLRHVKSTKVLKY